MRFVKRHRGLVIGGAVVLAGLLSLAAFVWRVCLVPYQNLMDLDWITQASEDEIVDASKATILLPCLDPHDAFLYLEKFGGPDDVPYLLWGLRWQKDTAPGEGMICTKAHCLDALQRITGHDAGMNYTDWAEWWESVDHQVPPRPRSTSD